jgi:1,4-dihydroxy-2-naphthoate octaprenyltransferase
MDVAMWVRALRVIPRIDKPAWDRLDVVSRWLIASRGAVLVITFISSGIAGLLAVRAGRFDPLLWALVTVGLLLAHATNNLVNDLTDHRRGVDRDNYFRAQYGPHPLEHGLMTTRQLVTYAAVTGALALAVGASLVAIRGGAALGLLVAGACFGKHIDKIVDDTAKKIRTLPVIMGERAARWLAIAMMAGQYVSLGYLVAIAFFSPLVLVVLFALPTLRDAVVVYLRPRPATRPAAYPADAWPLWYVAYAFAHNRRFGLLFLVGLIADLAVRALRP